MIGAGTQGSRSTNQSPAAHAAGCRLTGAIASAVAPSPIRHPPRVILFSLQHKVTIFYHSSLGSDSRRQCLQMILSRGFVGVLVRTVSVFAGCILTLRPQIVRPLCVSTKW